jgi:UDP-perosamine 4-acetyltransferase
MSGDSRKIVILGGGGHAKVLIDLIHTQGYYEVAGILDSGLENSSKVLGVPVLGGDELLIELFKTGVKMACIGVGSIKDNSIRKRLYEKAKQIGFLIPPLSHPHAWISEEAKLSEGAQIMAGSVIQASTLIGENTIINTAAAVDHDCIIGRDVHICPGAILSGGVSIGDNAFVGAGTTIIQGIKIGEGALIGAGSVVLTDVPAGQKVVGVPAR